MPRKAKPVHPPPKSEAVEAVAVEASAPAVAGGRGAPAGGEAPVRRRHQREDPPAHPPVEGAGLPDLRRHQRGAARVGREPGGNRQRPLHPAEPRDRDPRARPGRGLQAAPGGGRGGGIALLAKRHPRRPGADVPQADGPGAAADARAGGRDFQADRERRAQGPGGALPGRHRRPLHRRPRRRSCSTARSASTASSSTRRSRAATPISRRCPGWSRPPSEAEQAVRRGVAGASSRRRSEAERKTGPDQVPEARDTPCAPISRSSTSS